MFRRMIVFALLVASAYSQDLKTRPSTGGAPQTARQALIEILTTSNEKVMKRHLPEALVTRLDALTPQKTTTKPAAMVSSKDTQFFDSGPVFATYMPPKADQKLEVVVDRDELTGDGNVFEFSFRVSREGKEAISAIVPKVLARMKQEGETWRLAQLGVSVQVQLDDGAKLDELMRSAMSAMAAAAASAKPSETSTESVPKKRQGTDEWTPAKPAK